MYHIPHKHHKQCSLALLLLELTGTLQDENKILYKHDFNPEHVKMFFTTDYNDPVKTTASCKRMFLLLFGDLVYEHFKMRDNITHAFTPTDYFKKFTVAIEGLVMGLLKVQGPAITGLFDTKGKEAPKIQEVGDEQSEGSQYNDEPQEEEDTDENENSNTVNVQPSPINPLEGDTSGTKKRKKKAYKKPQMDNHKDIYEKYCEEAFERRDLILMHCNKKKPDGPATDAVVQDSDLDDNDEQKEACIVHGWYLKAIERVSELRQHGTTTKKRKSLLTTVASAPKKSNNWKSKQKDHEYDGLEGNPVNITAV
jgi:hypothetical protein